MHIYAYERHSNILLLQVTSDGEGIDLSDLLIAAFRVFRALVACAKLRNHLANQVSDMLQLCMGKVARLLRLHILLLSSD